MIERLERRRRAWCRLCFGWLCLGWLCFGWLFAASSLQAATVLQRHVDIEIKNDGWLLESTRLQVRLNSADDTVAWSTYRIYLDDHRQLVSLAAHIEFADGKRVDIEEQHQDLVEGASGGLFYASRRFLLIRFPGLEAGAVLVIEQELRFRPYYPASRVVLFGDEPIIDLRVRIDGAGDAWRWHLSGAEDVEGMQVEPKPGGLELRAGPWSPSPVPELAPAGSALRPELRFGWQRPGSWVDVGDWFGGMLDSVARQPDQVSEFADTVLSAAGDPWAKIDAVTDFMQRKIRYVAVVVGEGGYRPSPPAEVLARRWGDCKDKTVLMLDLLQAAGIRAFPALVRSGRERQVDSAFPSPDSFNHLIVAIDLSNLDSPPKNSRGLAGRPAQESAEQGADWLFIDPTQSRGGRFWLHPRVQGQLALIVRPGASALVSTPLRLELERRRLDAELKISSSGDAEGEARLRLDGELADRLIVQLAEQPSAAARDSLRILWASVLDGATVGDLDWQMAEEAVPTVELSASIRWPGWVPGAAQRPSLQLPAMLATPAPAMLEERSLSAVLPARGLTAIWRLRVPEAWCAARLKPMTVINSVGEFSQQISGQAGAWVVERRTTLRQQWFEGEQLAALHAIASAEHQAQRRRLRWRCDQ